MFTALVLSLSLGVAASGTTAVLSSVNGHWEGVMERGSSRLPISIDVDVKANRASFSATDLGALDIPLSSLRLEPALHWELVGDTTTTIFDASVHKNVMLGTFHENASSGTFVLKRISASTAKPYALRDFVFENAGIRLAGSVYVPQGPGKHPAVVFVHGSGAEGRWATAYIADYLARHGIIALSYDKRGVGASGGDWRTASMQDLVGDARAAVHALSQRPDVDRGRVGIYGHSQGGEIAPAIAVNNPDVTWVGAADGPVGPQYLQDLFRVDTALQQRYSGVDLTEAQAVYAEFVDVARNGTSHDQLRADMKKYANKPWLADLAIPRDDNWIWAWYRTAGNYDNSAAWAAVRVPVLLLFGSNDRLVPPQESIAEATRILKNNGNPNVWVRFFSGADHTLRIPPASIDGWPHNAPGFLDTLARFATNLALSPRQ
jgi:pimeloyl-ACP methyl ester carboxylesterase